MQSQTDLEQLRTVFCHYVDMRQYQQLNFGNEHPCQLYTKLHDLFAVGQKALCIMFYSQLSCD